MIKLKIAGVPEHFNLPWHLAIENNKFAESNIDLEWIDNPSGTGAMCKDLREGNIDLAVILTEGIVADIVKGNPSRILQYYVKSPLVWGIHTGAGSAAKTMEDLKDQQYAISRYGSGSHLMAFVDAQNRGWNPENLSFRVIDNLAGARKALAENETEGFMWEKFTTKPFVDNGEFRRIGECPTPWPCFVIAVREESLAKNEDAIRNVLKIINESCSEVQDNQSYISIFTERYGLKEEDVKEWFSLVKWAKDSTLNNADFENVQNVLHDLNLIDKKIPLGNLLA